MGYRNSQSEAAAAASAAKQKELSSYVTPTNPIVKYVQGTAPNVPGGVAVDEYFLKDGTVLISEGLDIANHQWTAAIQDKNGALTVDTGNGMQPWGSG